MPSKRKSAEKQAPSKPVHTMAERIAELNERKAKALEGESPEAMQRQHDRGKLTARERCEVLLDPGSFQEFDMLARNRARGFGLEKRRGYGDGGVAGWGTIDGGEGFVFSQDFTFIGGKVRGGGAGKICQK